MPEITIGTGRARERVPLLKERMSIGRARGNDIFLPDQWLSRQHAEIRKREGGFVLIDLASKNGTLLNGEPARGEQPLQDGDVITLGEHVLTFVDEAGLEPPPGTRVFSARELSLVRPGTGRDAAELARQNRILSVLSAAAKALLAHRPIEEVFEQVLDLLFEAVPAERGAILLLEGTPPKPVIKASRARPGQTPPASVPRSIARRVLTQLDSLLLPNLLEDTAFSQADSIMMSGIRAALCAPLWFRADDSSHDAVIGLVYLDSLLTAKPFTDEDLQIVTALANVAAAKIENARLLEESLEKRRLDEDMEVAAQIQRSLLPAGAPAIPGYDLAGCNFPCRAVGGDYYDFALTDGRLLLALGDVSGKGTGAALLMTMLRAAVRAHWAEGEISESVVRINRTVAENIPLGRYVTFFSARLLAASGELRYVNAGHNPALLVRADGTTETLASGGMVLGLFGTVPYEERATTLLPGDTLVLFSDGVTETWSPQDEEYGDARLAELVRESRHLAADALQRCIMSAVDSFAQGARATDDRTLVIVKRL